MGRGSKRPRRPPKNAKETLANEIDALARTQKFLNQKFGGYDDEIYDDVDDEDYEDQRNAAWGGRKSWYYGADNVDYELQSSDEDILLEEEAEAVRMQKEKAKFLTLEDFGLEEDDEAGIDSDSNEKKQVVLDLGKSRARFNIDSFLGETTSKSFEMKQIEANLPSQVDKNFIQKVATKSIDKLVNQSEPTNVLTKTHESPEKVSTHSAFDDSMKKKHNKHANQKDKIDQVGLQSMEMFKVRADLEAKLKCEGLYNVMNSKNGSNQKNSSKPINKHLETQDDFDDEVQLGENSGKHNISKPKVKISTHLPIYWEKRNNKYVNLRMEMLKVRADLEAKLKQKGLYNIKNSKNGSNQKNSSKPINQKNSLKPINKYFETLDDFDDEVQPVANGGKHSFSKLSKLIPYKGNKPKVFSGDDDLPMRDDIGERRRKHELRVLARARTVSMNDDIGLGKKAMNIDAHKDDDETTDPEDDFYKEVKRQRMEKLNAKAALYSRIPVAPPTLGTDEDGRPVRRPITDEMWKNKGLTRYRKKHNKNPRKKYKTKHQKAVMQRKGQVPDIRRPYGPYGGEATGINPYISRSVRFKN